MREDEEEEAPTLPELSVLRAAASRLVEMGQPSGWIGLTEVEEWLTKKHVAFDIGLPLTHLDRLVDLGILERHRDGSRFAVPGEAICRWLAARDTREAPLLPVTRRLDVDLVLNRYRQVRELGGGGQAKVWLAENVEERGHEVVLKIYEGTGPDVASLIEREGAALSRINSIYVVKCRGYRIDERKGGVVVLDWVNGSTLAELLERRPPAAQRILPGAELLDRVALASKLAEAVCAVHRAGVVHKDLKPQNIMMVEEGGVWRPTIIDFGIAAPESTADGNAKTAMMWTERYVAPEKRADPQTTRRRSADIYSLGVVLTDLLSGNVSVPPVEALTRLQVPAKLRDLMTSMMAASPEDRPTAEQTVSRLSGALEPDNWRELSSAAETAYIAAHTEEAAQLFLRAVAEAPRAEQNTEQFAKMLSDFVGSGLVVDSWHMIATVGLRADKYLPKDFWPKVFGKAGDHIGANTAGRSGQAQVLEALGEDGIVWTPERSAIAAAVADAQLVRELAEDAFEILLSAHAGDAIDSAAVARYCARQTRTALKAMDPMVVAENWHRRAVRMLPHGSKETQEAKRALDVARSETQTAAFLPPNVERKDLKALGSGEAGHVVKDKLERFAAKLIDSYSWIESVKRVRADGDLKYSAPTLLDDNNLAQHLVDAKIGADRIIPAVLDGSYTSFKGCLRVNIVLPVGTTAIQKAAARDVLARNRKLFP